MRAETFQVTHPFHPLSGKVFVLVTCHRNWAEERVYYHNEGGVLRSLPLAWTSLARTDPFVQVSAGRSAFRVADLLESARRLAVVSEQAEGVDMTQETMYVNLIMSAMSSAFCRQIPNWVLKTGQYA